MERNDCLRFSHDRYFGGFGFDEFRDAAKELEGLVKASRSSAESMVLTCEDLYTYNWSTVTIPTGEREAALKQRKEYSLDDVDMAIWDRSKKLELIIKIPGAKEPFMVCLTYDKGEKDRLFFYGQELDVQTYRAIMDRFHKRGLLYVLGDGFSRPSDFGYIVIRSKLGM